jgi:hypothetical protein
MPENKQEKKWEPITTLGIVKGGVVVPNIPLPEGSRVGIRVYGPPLDIPPDLEEELRAHQLAGAEALELVERLASEKGNDRER